MLPRSSLLARSFNQDSIAMYSPTMQTPEARRSTNQSTGVT